MRNGNGLIGRLRGVGLLVQSATDFSESEVTFLAESEDHGMVCGFAFFAELARGEGFRLVHGESGFDRLLPRWVHDLGACLVVEEPALALMDRRAVHDGYAQEVIAVVFLLDQHELTGGGDREFLICYGFFEVRWKCTEEESVLHPRGSVLGEVADVPLRHAFFFRQDSNGLGFFEGVHLQSSDVFDEGRDLIDVFALHDAGGDGGVAEELAGGEPAASGDQAPASAVTSRYYDRLQESVGPDLFGQLANALIRDRLPHGGAFHVDLIDVNVLLHAAPPGVIYFDSGVGRSQRKSYPQFPPQSPLSEEIKT